MRNGMIHVVNYLIFWVLLLLLPCHPLTFCHGSGFCMQFGDEIEKFIFTELPIIVDQENANPNEEVVKAQIFFILAPHDSTVDNRGFIKNLRKTFNEKMSKASELVVLQDIIDMVSTAPLDGEGRAELLADILQGAHVHIVDDGTFYTKWSQMDNAKARISSHAAKADSIQYGISGPWIHEILFGVVDHENTDATFFQLENSPYGREILNSIRHVIDYLKYRVRGKNQGPYGESEHKDDNPIFINKDGEIWEFQIE